ncbi:MAG: diaminopimelate decarboxylase [Chloroflexi bacterium]|nr:diaminopimelate decarboxylase [Chloroflexota bacterium]
MLNDSIYHHDGALYCDSVLVSEIAVQVGTPVYIYSLRRVVSNLRRIQTAFADLQPHIHYSAKANANLAVLRALVEAGAGIDAVSGGEIYRALLAGAKAENIVFAGVGKTRDELRYALEQGVGWFNVENVGELHHLNELAADNGKTAQVALRLNPDVAAQTHRHIATGHGGAKFGLPAEVVRDVLARQADYPALRFDGIHVHIGSQLHDTQATQRAVEIALELIAPYPEIRTVNIGGGLPVAYAPDERVPAWDDFAATLAPLLRGYTVLLEPGRSIIADAGLLVVSVLYVKQQAGQTFLITDGSMAELIRPALYEAHHEIVLVNRPSPSQGEGRQAATQVHIVGPVCETSDMLGRSRALPDAQPGDLLAVLTAGAYGMVMASNYNQRPRPPEVVVTEDGQTWRVVRRRETWDDLVRLERNVYDNLA